MPSRLFISDLHLSDDSPILLKAFTFFLNTYIKDYDELYILGDWFEAWIGDDDDSEWLANISWQLRELTNQGKKVFVLHGNRDFLLGTPFIERFNGQLLDEVSYLKTNKGKIRLEHGDLLCTDDEKYQQFRLLSRNPAWQATMLNRPLAERKQIAQFMRLQSKMSQQTMENIVDVNEQAVKQALTEADILLHGHTHRPALHMVNQQQRFVLGDWRIESEKHVSAIIGCMINDDLQLKEFHWQET